MKLEKIVKLINPNTTVRVGYVANEWKCDLDLEYEEDIATEPCCNNPTQEIGCENCPHLTEAARHWNEYEGAASGVPIQLANNPIYEISVYEFEAKARRHKVETKYGLCITLVDERKLAVDKESKTKTTLREKMV